MKNYENQTYALMRITTGFMFLCHGAQKFMVMPEEARPWHIQWIAAPIEFFGGGLNVGRVINDHGVFTTQFQGDRGEMSAGGFHDFYSGHRASGEKDMIKGQGGQFLGYRRTTGYRDYFFSIK